MFFDNILLQPQHKGKFGMAWLAATRGVNKLSKDELLEVNISELCESLLNYVISESVHPEERFSLRLSVILLNGILRIFEEKVRILEEQVRILVVEVTAAIETVHIPAVQRGLPGVQSSQNSTPLTPVTKTKEKKTKKPAESTLISSIQQEIAIADLFEPVPDVPDILAFPCPSSDLVTLREEMPRQPVIEENIWESLGILTDEELRETAMNIIKPRISPQPASSSSPDPRVFQIQVQAQVHAEKVDSPGEQAPPIETTAVPTSTIRKSPVISTVGEIVVASKPSPRTEELSLNEVTRMDTERVLKKKQFPTNKVFVTRSARRIVPINRCNECQFFDNKSCGRIIAKNKNQELSGLENLIMSVEDVTTDQMMMPTSISHRTASIDSLIRGTSTPHGRSTLESDALRGQDYPAESTQIQQALIDRTRSSVKQVSAHPEIPVLMEEQSFEAREPLIELQIAPQIAPQIVEIPSDQNLLAIEELASEQILPAIEEIIKTTELEHIGSSPIDGISTAFPISSTPRREFSPILARESTPEARIKRRRQNIVNIVRNWDFDSQLLTIEDVAEKPINRLTIARAFYDLLVLSASKYVSLKSEEDNNELKNIEKGPKLL